MSAERIDSLKTILQSEPQNTFARYALGMEYSSAGETDAAVAQFQTLLETDAKYANAYFMAAQALDHAGRTEEAAEWLRKGIQCAHEVGNRHAESEMQAMLDEIEL